MLDPFDPRHDHDDDAATETFDRILKMAAVVVVLINAVFIVAVILNWLP